VVLRRALARPLGWRKPRVTYRTYRMYHVCMRRRGETVVARVLECAFLKMPFGLRCLGTYGCMDGCMCRYVHMQCTKIDGSVSRQKRSRREQSGLDQPPLGELVLKTLETRLVRGEGLWSSCMIPLFGLWTVDSRPEKWRMLTSPCVVLLLYDVRRW
jgi:hypothetical protein